MGASAEGGSECGERERVREAGASAGANYEACLKIEYLTNEVENFAKQSIKHPYTLIYLNT